MSTMNLETKKIVAIEDEKHIRDLLTYHLVKNKYAITACSSAEEARPVIQSQCPHLIILDLMLPKMSGLELCKELKKNPKTKDAFSYDYNERAYELRALPPELPKYVVYDPGDIGINITQFLTNTATPASQVKKNLYYVPRETLDLINPPMGVYITDLK